MRAYLCRRFSIRKTPQPSTKKEVDLMWKPLKKQKECAGSQIKDFLMDKGEIAESKCKCVHKFKQQHSLVQTIRKPYACSEFSDQMGSSENKKQAEENEI